MDQPEKKMKVLIVEDDTFSRQYMASVVRLGKYELMEARNGVEGLKLFESFAPDLIFSDISMPVMDGLEMLERIRRRSHDTIVIMTTAFGSAEFTLKALRLRANDYLVKPILPKDISAILKKYAGVLSARSVEREVVGLILERNLKMKLDNRLEMLGKVADRLMQESEGRISPADRMGIRLGLLEIMINAIEHGNLDITYFDKTRATESREFDLHDLIVERGNKEPYKSRRVHIQFQMTAEMCEWVITDEGTGFDWRSVPDPNDPANLMSMHGRGIMLARLNFDEVIYIERGNQVILRKRLQPAN
ncbi:MAG: response regulator [Candidatus Riflebacteria bacterium]|nr:response regulator [Candidatus Riflebacteria bacterium]